MHSMTVGTVYLVGAGPGHPDLLTVRAVALLKSADVVVYDRLIQPAVLDHAGPSAERIDMGKTEGAADATQRAIHAVLLAKAREGRMVVRLKGGDPYLFGRGAEEAEFLAAHGVPFEVVPGVSSLTAAPLRAGIPVTHRGVASAVAFVTGHESNAGADELDWDALSRVQTLVIVMVARNLRIVAGRLLDAGRAASTPAALIHAAYWHDERVVIGTLGSIADEAERADIGPPATLVVGEVVGLRDRIGGAARRCAAPLERPA
jgi:uroporphyrin-III C-methyltransferase